MISPPPTFPHLFAPLTLRATTLPNRVVVTAMVTRLSGEDGYVNQDITDRYVRFAEGGAGLIVVEATAVHESKSGPLLRLSADEFIAGHRQLLRRMHDAGPSRIALQIIHYLKISRRGWRQTVEALAPSDLAGIVAAYAAAAVRTRDAGYDAVELHMAHAYTLSSFLSRLNRRHDAYGGRSLEGRMRLPTEVLMAVRQAVGDDFPVGVRFDAEECVKGGYGLPDAEQIALRFAQTGADYISLSAGGKFEDAVRKDGEPLYPYTGYSGDRTMPGAQYPDAPNVYLAAGVRAHLRAHGWAAPVVASGKISTPALAEAILARGDADLIGLARAALADPDWPAKAALGADERIVRCVYGNICKALDENFRQVRCVLWPKGSLHAPRPPTIHRPGAAGRADESVEPGPSKAQRQPDLPAPPAWPPSARIAADLRDDGTVRVSWTAAQADHGVYGYEIWRAMDGAPLERQSACTTTGWVDAQALSGHHYRYVIKAYDFAGQRSAPTAEASADLPDAWALVPGEALDAQGQASGSRSRPLDPHGQATEAGS